MFYCMFYFTCDRSFTVIRCVALVTGSSHVNAFLHGFSSSTSIVLYDRLLVRGRRSSMSSVYTSDEVLAIVSHEIGHWSLNHIPKLFIFYQVRHADLSLKFISTSEA